MRVLHIVPDSVENPVYRYLGSTKDVRGRTEYFRERGIPFDEVPVVRTDAKIIEALAAFDLTRYSTILLDVPGSYPHAFRKLKLRAPQARLLFRAHNAEALHRLDWMRACRSKEQRRDYRNRAVEGLANDLRTAWTVHGILPIADADTASYWRWLRPGLEVRTVPYFLPDEFVPPAGRAAKEDTVVCVTSLQFNPLLEEALENFLRMARTSGEAGLPWRFVVQGDVGARTLPAGVEAIGLRETPFEGLGSARAVALLSDLGRGFKTKILEAVFEQAWTLVTPGLLDRMPPEVAAHCIAVDPRDPASVRAALERCREPLPIASPNLALRERAFRELDAVFKPEKPILLSAASREAEERPVCVGLPVHNGARHLRQALDTLLAQTYRDFQVVAFDDGSTDGSWDILAEYAAKDSRIRLERSEKRTGLVAAWRRVAELAGEYSPKYFAWYGDHDWVKPQWLEVLAAELESDPGLVLAHAWSRWIEEDGSLVKEPPAPAAFDTSTLGLWDRITATVNRPLGAGDAVYGLFRYDALRDCGLYRYELLPDQLLLSELQLHGGVRYVAQKLRFRRTSGGGPQESGALIGRQVRTLFADGPRTPYPLTSFATVFLREVVEGRQRLGYQSSEMTAARIHHANLHFTHSVQRLDREIRAEFEAGGREDERPWWRALAENQSLRPGLVTWSLYNDQLLKSREAVAR